MTDRITGIIDRLTDADQYSDIAWILDAPVENIAWSVVDDTMKANADFQYRAGLPAKVVRKTEPSGFRSVKRGNKTISYRVPCKWCQRLAGTYTYPNVPKEVWQRHDGCECIITYTPAGGGRIDTLAGDMGPNAKKWYLDESAVEQRKQFTGIDTEPKAVQPQFVFVPAETIEDAKVYANNVLGLRTSLDYPKMNLDVANMVNEELTNAYNTFGNLHEMGVLDELRVVPGKHEFYFAYNPSFQTIIMPRSQVGYKSSIGKLRQGAIDQKEMGFWSTGDPAHAIRHEIGHAVEKAHLRGNDTAMAYIEDFRESEMSRIGVEKWTMNTDVVSYDTIKDAGETLSYYALKDNGETVAESVAEYLTGDPREPANGIIEVLLDGVDI